MPIRHALVRRSLSLAVAGTVLAAATGVAAALDQIAAGPQGDGTAVATYGWKITPAGAQKTLGEKPFGAALSPDGQLLAVSNDGINVQSLSLVDATTGSTLQRIDYKRPEALFVGLAWSPDGDTLYASAGGNDKIRRYALSGDKLTERSPITLPKGTTPAGLAMSADGSHLYAAGNGSGSLVEVDPASGTVLHQVATGRNPYGVTLTGDGKTALVSNWGQRTVSLVDTATGTVRGAVEVGSHPTAFAGNPVTGDIYVSVTDDDSIAVLDGTTGALRRSINLSPYHDAPVGTSPLGLSVSPTGRILYAAAAGNNDVAVVRLANPQDPTSSDRVAGLIPTAWYPTTVTATQDGSRLLVTNAKGLGAGPNPGGPNPYKPTDLSQYGASMTMGTLSVVPVPGQQRLAHWTSQVRRNDRFTQPGGQPTPANVVPARPGDPSPIKHVIYVVKENRTYDQVFGSLGKGNGDPSLNLFGDDSAPNQRDLARRFVTLDNFYCDGAVSSDGWEWSTAATSNAYNEHEWTIAYGARGHGDDVYTNPSNDPGRVAGDSRIWDRLDDAGVSYRNYGMWARGPLPATVYPTEPRLAAHTDPQFAAQNANIRDVSRLDAWKREFDDYITNGNLPTMQFIRLANDHTVGTTPGGATPKAAVADNDLAVGRLVDTVSHSPYWKNTAIFVVEDDAQAGPDHVDAHRTTALVISPYTQTGRVDSTMYSTVSMLRTMELIVGINPLTQYDAAATPMNAAFTTHPNLAPYNARTPSQSLDEVNKANAPMAKQSARMNFKVADANSEQVLNRAIWQGVRGAGSQPPAPVSNPHLRLPGVPSGGQQSAGDPHE